MTIKLLILSLLLAGCAGSKNTSDCKAKPIKDCMCTADYAPVCGCDGKTYSNACEARCAGVKTWTVGDCD